MKRYPLVKFTLIFISGIILQNFLQTGGTTLLILLFIALLCAFLSFKLRNYRLINSACQVFLYLGTALSGQITLALSGKNAVTLPADIFNKSILINGEITSIDLKRERGFGFIISSDSIMEEKRILKIKSKFICRFVNDNQLIIDSCYSALIIGDKIAVKGKILEGKGLRNPGGFDYGSYLKRLGISGTININNSSDIKITGYSNTFWFDIFEIRRSIDRKLTQIHSPPAAALLRGLLLADRSLIDSELINNYINSGVVHVLAVSGLHVGFIVLIFLILAGRFNLYIRSALTIIGLIFFILLTGMPASVVRAAIMSIVLIIAFLSNRSTNLFNSLALSALIILIFNPNELFSPGFQLSYSAVLSIAVINPEFQRWIEKTFQNKKSVKNFLLSIGLSLSAQIGTLPLLIFYFAKISLAALLANLIVIPTIGIIVSIGIVTVALSYIYIYSATYFAAANDLLVFLLNNIVNFAGGNEYSYISVRNFSVIDMCVFYIFLIMLMYVNKKCGHLSVKLLAIFLTLLNIVVYTAFDDRDLLKKNKLNIMMIDVGQGDSFLIKFPAGETALIDAGNATPYSDNGEKVIIPLLSKLGIDKIDYGFISHIDSDHFAGFISLVLKGKIKKIYKPPLDSANDKDKRFEKFLSKFKIPVSYYNHEILKIGNARVYILNLKVFNSGRKQSTNSRSGLLKVVYGKTSVLFTGDLEESTENLYTLRYSDFLNSSILKISHHGSKTGTSDTFIKTVKPQLCLISAGLGNKFGHPAAAVIEKIKSVNAKIARTDSSGASLFQSDGEKISEVDWRNF